MDSKACRSKPARTPVDACGHGLENYGSKGWGSNSQGSRRPSGRAAKPLRERGFLSSSADVDSPWSLVGPRLGREVSSPDVFQSSDECPDVGGEEVGVAVHGHRDGRVAEVDLVGILGLAPAPIAGWRRCAGGQGCGSSRTS